MSNYWDDCPGHEWIETNSDYYLTDERSSVKCKICDVPGELTRETGEVYWPAT